MFLVAYRNADRTIARFRVSVKALTAKGAFDLLSVSSGEEDEYISMHNLDVVGMDNQQQEALLSLSDAIDTGLFSEGMELGLLAMINMFITNDEGKRLEIPST